MASRRLWVAFCHQCKAPSDPFDSAEKRDVWAQEHADTEGHAVELIEVFR